MVRFFIACMSATAVLFSAITSQQVVQTTVDATKRASKTQSHIDAYAKEQQALYEAYITTKKALEAQQQYNEQLQAMVASQEAKLQSIATQLDEIELTKKQILPLMNKMASTYSEFVALDAPFLLSERTQRAKTLRANLSSAELTLSQSFQQLIGAYKNEYEYARTLEVYRDKLDASQETVVNFLRIGRLALYYQSLDGKRSAIYDKKANAWHMLDASYNDEISKAIKIASKKLAPDFLTLPMLVQGGAHE